MNSKFIINNLVEGVLSFYSKNRGNLKGALIDLKDKLSQEGSETVEMLSIYSRSVRRQQVSKEELKRANEQMLDLLKIVGLTIPQLVPLPFVGTMIFLVVLKLGKICGVNVLPTAWTEDFKKVEEDVEADMGLDISQEGGEGKTAKKEGK